MLDNDRPDAELGGQLAGLAHVAGRAITAPPVQAIRRRGHRRMVRQRTALAALAAVLLGAGAATAHSLTLAHVPVPAASMPPAAPSPSPSASASPSVGTSGSTGASTVGCARPDVVVSLGSGDAGMGHRSVVLVFTNKGSRPCRMAGYPGVAALDGGGSQVAQAQRTLNGYLGGVASGSPPRVTLAAGQQASALVEGLGSTGAVGPCTGYAGVLVTIPDDTASTRLSWATDVCSDLQVHPVVPGTTGNSP